MRSMYERRPRSVWFADAVKPSRVASGGSDSGTS
jgi:hypothetical protein